jgi:hypothetical protein
LDDVLRPQTIAAGVPAILVEAISQWDDEILVLRELLGILQTLCWDIRCVKSVLQADIIASLIDFVQSLDMEVSVLALASLANILSFCDTLLLADTVTIESLGMSMVVLMDILKRAHHRSQRLYAMASISNACAHPRLQSILKSSGGSYSRLYLYVYLLYLVLLFLCDN